MHSFFTSRLSQTQQVLVKKLADSLGVPVDWICCVIYYESKFNYKAVNSVSGAYGLIQFMPDSGKSYKTINGKIYQMSTIKAMDFEQQINLVYEYYKPHIKKVTSYIDLYLVTFYPVAVGKPDDFVIGSERSTAWVNLITQQNKPYDVNKDGKITKLEIENYFSNYYNKLLQNPSVDLKKKSQMLELKNFWIKYRTYIIAVGSLGLGALLWWLLTPKKKSSITNRR